MEQLEFPLMADERINLVRPPVKRIWQYQLTLNIHTPHDSAINPPGYRPNKNTYEH